MPKIYNHGIIILDQASIPFLIPLLAATANNNAAITQKPIAWTGLEIADWYAAVKSAPCPNWLNKDCTA